MAVECNISVAERHILVAMEGYVSDAAGHLLVAVECYVSVAAELKLCYGLNRLIP